MIMKWVTVEKSPIWPMFAVDTYFVTLMSVAVPMLNETCIDTALQNTGPSQHTPSGKTTNNRSCKHQSREIETGGTATTVPMYLSAEPAHTPGS